MRENRLLLPAALILIITGCSTAPYLSDQAPRTVTANTGIDSAVSSGKQIRNHSPRDTGPDQLAARRNHAADVPGPDSIIAEPGDLWQRISSQLHLGRNLQQPSVRDKLAWYSKKQDYLDRVSDRARPYLHYIVQELDRRGMPLELALLPIVESAYHPFAHSPSRASGIWQFIPSTGKRYGLKQNWWYDGRRDIVAATGAALDYLTKLNQEFGGDWLLALAAYNTGELNVAKAIKRNQRMGKKQDFWSLSLPRETRGYVPSLLAVAELVANPDKHGIAWKPIPDTPYFTQIDTGGQLDLALVAELSGQTMDEVYTLNPGYNRWATDPDGPHYLLLPVAKAEPFRTGLGKLSQADRLTWTRHVIQNGETLGGIARRYHISIDALKQANGMRGNLIHIGNSLLIPTARQPDKHYSMSADARMYRGLQKTGPGDKFIYTIQRGDNLWDIGQRYGLSVERLRAWNGLPDDRLLKPGQKLTLWLDAGKTDPNPVLAAAPGASGTGAATGNDRNATTTYTVKLGDTLWQIAKTFGTSISQLMSWNNLTQNSMLKPGQLLSIMPLAPLATGPGNTQTAGSTPMKYTVKKGDNLWLISKRFGTTISQLLRWNNLSESRLLQPGQTLVLYLNEA